MGILGIIAGLIAQTILIIRNFIANTIDNLITAEYVSLNVFPHYNYKIVCGGGIRSGKSVGMAHLSPSVVFLGADTSYYTVIGDGYRDGRQPYIPMVGGTTNIPLTTWVGSTITSCSGGGTSVGNQQWYARVKFKCVSVSGMYLPPLSLYDFTMIGNRLPTEGAPSESQGAPVTSTAPLLSAIISSGMILGPAPIWLASMAVARIATRASIQGSDDFNKAMSPAALQEYMRVE